MIKPAFTVGLMLALVCLTSAAPAIAVDEKRVKRDMSYIFDELLVLRSNVEKLETRVKILEKEKLLKDWKEDDDWQSRFKIYDCVQDPELGWVLKERKAK